MLIPPSILVLYCCLLFWVILLANKKYRSFLMFGIVLMCVLNSRYFIEGPAEGIRWFLSVYDVFHNFGVTDYSATPTLVRCTAGLNNTCSLWDESVYSYHAEWAVTFFDRFSSGGSTLTFPSLGISRTMLLYCHIASNSIGFTLLQLNLLFNAPPSSRSAQFHRWVGFASYFFVLFGVSAAVGLASEHVNEPTYGNEKAEYGFYFMSACVLLCPIMALRAIQRKDYDDHRRWNIRFAGAVWGSFWLFRVMELVLGPLFRGIKLFSLLLTVWTSAPLGILIAELIVIRQSGKKEKKTMKE